jgi:hypothetical protein
MSRQFLPRKSLFEKCSYDKIGWAEEAIGEPILFLLSSKDINIVYVVIARRQNYS